MRAAIIGCGRVGVEFELDDGREKPASHLGAYVRNPEVSLVAVADLDESKASLASKLATDMGAGPVHIYTDYEKMMNEEKLDIVSVCTPPETHAQIVRNCARYHPLRIIFCEKPLSTNVADATKMVETCKQFSVKLACNMTRRWSFAFRHLKEKLEQGLIGDLLTFRGIFCGETPLNIGIHAADLACWFREKNTTVQLTHADVPYILFDIDLIGSRGRIQTTYNGTHFIIYYPSSEKLYDEKYGRNLETYDDLIGLKYSFSEAMQNAVADLVTCVKTDKQPDCSGEDGLKALELCLSRFKKEV